MFKWGKKLFQQGKKLFQQPKKIFQQPKKIVYGSVIIDIGSWNMNNEWEHIIKLNDFEHKEILSVSVVVRLDPPLQRQVCYIGKEGSVRIENNNKIVLHHLIKSYYGISNYTKETGFSRGKIKIEYREKLC